MAAAAPRLALPARDAFGGRARLTVADALVLARRRAPGELAAKARRRLARPLRSTDTVIVLVKDLDDIVVCPPSGRLRIEPIGPEHLPALHELNRRRGASRKTRNFIADLRGGCGGFAVLARDDAVGFYWFVGGPAAAEHADVRRLAGAVELDDGDLYGYDFFLDEAVRGGNAAGEALTLVETALRARGCRRLWGYVDADNRPARWLYATRRYRPVRRLTTRTLLGYRSHQLGPP